MPFVRRIARKADVNAPQVDGSTALHWAVELDDLAMADQLIRAGARVAARTREGVTPLQLAAINGSAALIDRLLKAGADPNAPLNASGDTALMMAARTGKADAIRVLLEANASLNAKESWGGTTPLMWAVSEGHIEAAGVLIAAGADVNARSHYVAAANGRGFEGRTPLADAAEAKPADFASGWLSPLMLAAREGDVGMARVLLDAGADVNAVAGDGKTALALAIFNGNYEVASVLVDSKADVNTADSQRFTPLVLCRRSPQHGDGAELPVDGDRRPAAAHPQAARRRRQSQRHRQQHAARPDARGVAAHRVRHRADARSVRGRSASWSRCSWSMGRTRR